MNVKGYYEPLTKNIIDQKALSELEELKVECKCGHKSIMPVYVDKTICSYCHRIVLNNSKAYFMYKMRKAMKKNEKTDNNNISGVNRVDNSN